MSRRLDETTRAALLAIGERIRTARQDAGLTQEDLAGRTGIDYKRIQKLEAGAVNATVRTLVRVALALEVDFSSLTDLRS